MGLEGIVDFNYNNHSLRQLQKAFDKDKLLTTDEMIRLKSAVLVQFEVLKKLLPSEEYKKKPVKTLLDQYANKIEKKLTETSKEKSNKAKSCVDKARGLFEGVFLLSALKDVDKKYVRRQQEVVELFVKVNAMGSYYVLDETSKKANLTEKQVSAMKGFISQINQLIQPIWENVDKRKQAITACFERHQKRPKGLLNFTSIFISIARINTQNDAIMAKLAKYTTDTVLADNDSLQKTVRERDAEIKDLKLKNDEMSKIVNSHTKDIAILKAGLLAVQNRRIAGS